MNTAEKIANLDPSDIDTTSELERALLYQAFSLMSPAQKNKLLATCRRNVKAFEHSSAPGHSNWYPRHLQVLGLLEKMMGIEKKS